MFLFFFFFSLYIYKLDNEKENATKNAIGY